MLTIYSFNDDNITQSLTSVAIEHGEERGRRVVGEREDVRVRVLHGDPPALHAAGADSVRV